MDEKKMNIYTKSGDKGMTSLKGAQSVSKSDDRIQLLGAIDELTSHLGVVKSEEVCAYMIPVLEQIQSRLITVMAAIADSYNQKYRLSQSDVEELEHEIDRLEASFPREKTFILPGGCRASAQLDVARTVARRAERCMVDVAKRHSVDLMTKQYMNRLSDYLYVNARYVDYLHTSGAVPDIQKKQDVATEFKFSEEKVVQKVLKEIDAVSRISLDSAKKLIELLETYSEQHGRKSVISVCGPDGNMIAVHAMDHAFIASFEISMKKAYTSVAVKMSTMELSKLAQPGQTFYGVENTDNGRIVIFGGGIPLTYHGKIIGGLGVSGGTGEEDHETAKYGLEMLETVLEE
ncbi:MAG: cob(I)yrinic acid a,c-diamide adenosyltransferase [Hespellia sp.]|nr:cob(I)yrinic acid a,c-diamide adenosyltransferase [Hespellia sp.]